MTDQRADTLPFVAPCRPVAATAPLQWLSRGWQELRAGRRASLAYGLALAALSSANAVLRSKPAALLWGIIILALVLIGFATAFLAFVVIFPLLGHATWHAYRATIDASAWPVRES